MSPLPTLHSPHTSGRAAAPRSRSCRCSKAVPGRIIRAAAHPAAPLPPLQLPSFVLSPAPGDAPVLPCLPESTARPAWAGHCPSHQVTPWP